MSRKYVRGGEDPIQYDQLLNQFVQFGNELEVMQTQLESKGNTTIIEAGDDQNVSVPDALPAVVDQRIVAQRLVPELVRVSRAKQLPVLFDAARPLFAERLAQFSKEYQTVKQVPESSLDTSMYKQLRDVLTRMFDLAIDMEFLIRTYLIPQANLMLQQWQSLKGINTPILSSSTVDQSVALWEHAKFQLEAMDFSNNIRKRYALLNEQWQKRSSPVTKMGGGEIKRKSYRKQALHSGRHGGQYYLNSKGNKVYIKRFL